MTALSFRDAMRLKEKLGISPSQIAMLVAVLDGEGRASVEDMLTYARSCCYKAFSPASFRVQLAGLNAKLPATVHIGAAWEDKRWITGKPRAGSRPADYYELSKLLTEAQAGREWAREYLLRLARGDELEPEAQSPERAA